MTTNYTETRKPGLLKIYISRARGFSAPTYLLLSLLCPKTSGFSGFPGLPFIFNVLTKCKSGFIYGFCPGFRVFRPTAELSELQRRYAISDTQAIEGGRS